MTRLFELAGRDPERRFSPYCFRIRMALAHQGIEAERIAWRFADKAAIAPSGQGKVPVLVDRGRWLSGSQAIAEYVEEAYPDRPSLFAGTGGEALSRFVTAWTDTVVHGAMTRLLVLDVLRHVHPEDEAYFRASREQRFGAPLEEVVAGREAKLPDFRASLEPARQLVAKADFLVGAEPLYADYTLFGEFQWARSISAFSLLEADDPIALWRARMLGLFDGLAARAPGYPA